MAIKWHHAYEFSLFCNTLFLPLYDLALNLSFNFLIRSSRSAVVHGTISKYNMSTLSPFIADVSMDETEHVMEDLKKEGYDCWQTAIGGPGVGLHFGEPDSHFSIPPALQSRAKLCNIL